MKITGDPAENERVIEAFLSEHDDFALEPFEAEGLPKNQGMMTFYPHRIRGEGHFAAKMKKSGHAPGKGTFGPPHQKTGAVTEWLRQNGFEMRDELIYPYAGRAL